MTHFETLQPMFRPLPASGGQVLDLLAEALKRVRPLNTAQRRALPEDAARLSRVLTTERDALQRPYWASPAMVSAYLYFFLPWNILRLMRLFSGLDLPPPDDSGALLMDIGSGPLTLPLALWLARPDLEAAPVRLLAMDSSPQPLELGKKLFETLAAMTGRQMWPVRVERASLAQIARRPVAFGHVGARPWLLTAANVLNELPALSPSHCDEHVPPDDDLPNRHSRELDDEGSGTGQMLRIFEAFSRLWAAGAAEGGVGLLCVEPGTRLGGKTIMRLRAEILARGLSLRSPCAHDSACPLVRGKGRGWCHFTFDCSGAPKWLERLSTQAGLAKNSLSLAFVLARGAAAEEQGKASESGTGALKHGEAAKAVQARVLSEAFVVPGLRGKARYACCARGLLLLEDAAALAQGALLRLHLGHDALRDAKSGALLVNAPGGRFRNTGA